ncbi:MAG TPA: sialidase family protein [Vicinamibacterales bacterium]|nr:sialidase family protein [Vicinamibacterales bacterium]
MRKLSAATDPHGAVVLMAQLENTQGQGETPNVSQGDVTVSRSVDGGVTWSEPVTVLRGTGAGIGPANRATPAPLTMDTRSTRCTRGADGGIQVHGDNAGRTDLRSA